MLEPRLNAKCPLTTHSGHIKIIDMHRIIAPAFFLISITSYAGSSSWQPESVPQSSKDKMLLNLPNWVSERARTSKLEKTHSIDLSQNPYYLTADFDDDDLIDVAVRVKERSSSKLGIAVFLRKQNGHHLLGAGRDFGNGGDSFTWLHIWNTASKSDLLKSYWEEKPPNPVGDILEVAKFGSASAAIYWDGKTFVWYQVGD